MNGTLLIMSRRPGCPVIESLCLSPISRDYGLHEHAGLTGSAQRAAERLRSIARSLTDLGVSRRLAAVEFKIAMLAAIAVRLRVIAFAFLLIAARLRETASRLRAIMSSVPLRLLN